MDRQKNARMKIAIVSNPNSSLTAEKMVGIYTSLQELLEEYEVIVHTRLGGDFFPDAQGVVKLSSAVQEMDYKALLRTSILEILQEKPILIITVGGDGLASYVADTVITHLAISQRPAMLGVAAGTANVGPIVSLAVNQLPFLKLDAMEIIEVDAIEVLDGSEHVGYAFNDVIIGNSLLATIGGKVSNISVEALVTHDKKVTIQPGHKIVDKTFTITTNGQITKIKNNKEIKQIIVTSLQFDQLYGRAIFGALCLGKERGPMAAIGLSNRVIVDADFVHWSEPEFTTIQHLVFTPNQEITLCNLGEDAHIVIDGNPYLRKSQKISFRLLPAVLKVLRSHRKGGTRYEAND